MLGTAVQSMRQMMSWLSWLQIPRASNSEYCVGSLHLKRLQLRHCNASAPCTKRNWKEGSPGATQRLKKGSSNDLQLFLTLPAGDFRLSTPTRQYAAKRTLCAFSLQSIEGSFSPSKPATLCRITFSRISRGVAGESRYNPQRALSTYLLISQGVSHFKLLLEGVAIGGVAATLSPVALQWATESLREMRQV